MRHLALSLLLLASLTGCEVAARFDRDKIPPPEPMTPVIDGVPRFDAGPRTHSDGGALIPPHEADAGPSDGGPAAASTDAATDAAATDAATGDAGVDGGLSDAG